MRIDEFERAATIHRRRSMFAFLGPLGAAFAFLVAFVPFRDAHWTFLSTRFAPDVFEVLKTLPMWIALLIAFGWMIPLSRRVNRNWDIPCPHCGKGLAQHPSVVIASRNCPHCGGRVIED